MKKNWRGRTKWQTNVLLRGIGEYCQVTASKIVDKKAIWKKLSF